MMNKPFDKAMIPKGIFIVAALAAALVFSEKSAQGVKSGIFYCAETLVPSLFPFMFISAFIARSGLSSVIGKPLSRATKLCFGLSGDFAAVIVMSLIGGYPVGAGMIAGLLKQGRVSAREAKKASYFAVASGAGFTVTFIGTRLLHSTEAGLCVFAAQACSVILLGFAGKILYRDTDNYNSHSEIKPSPPLSEAIVDSTAAAAANVAEMCAMVVLFSAMISIVQIFFNSPVSSTALEVTRAVSELSTQKNVTAIAFAVGFGGLCVHFQIFRLLRGVGINKILFFLYRIIQGIITAALTKVFLKAFGVSVPVFSSVSSAPTVALSATVLGSFLLTASGLCFLSSLKTKNN